MYFFRNGGSRKGNFRNKDNVCSACETRVQGYPSSMTAHYLQNHYSVMRLGGGVQSVESLCCNVKRSYKSKRQLGASQIVVDSFRNSANRNATLVEFSRNSKCTFP